MEVQKINFKIYNPLFHFQPYNKTDVLGHFMVHCRVQTNVLYLHLMFSRFAQPFVSLNTHGISAASLKLIIKHRNTHFSLYILVFFLSQRFVYCQKSISAGRIIYLLVSNYSFQPKWVFQLLNIFLMVFIAKFLPIWVFPPFHMCLSQWFLGIELIY